MPLGLHALEIKNRASRKACPALVLFYRLYLARLAEEQGGKVYRFGIEHEFWLILIEFSNCQFSCIIKAIRKD